MALRVEETDAAARLPYLLCDGLLGFEIIRPDAAEIDDGDLIACDRNL